MTTTSRFTKKYTKTKIDLCGFRLTQMFDIDPEERSFMQGLYRPRQIEFQKSTYKTIQELVRIAGLPSEIEAFTYLKLYANNETANIPENVLIALDYLELQKSASADPKAAELDADLELLTFMIDRRLDKDDLIEYADEFAESYGLKFEGDWTYTHTLALETQIPEFMKFVNLEINKGKSDSIAAPETPGENSPESSQTSPNP